MRIKKRQPDYGAISRRSIKNDFRRVQTYSEREKRPQIENPPEINAERVVICFQISIFEPLETAWNC